MTLYRFPSLFAVNTFRHFGHRILNLHIKSSFFFWKIVILNHFANVSERNRSEQRRLTVHFHPREIYFIDWIFFLAKKSRRSWKPSLQLSLSLSLSLISPLFYFIADHCWTEMWFTFIGQHHFDSNDVTFIPAWTYFRKKGLNPRHSAFLFLALSLSFVTRTVAPFFNVVYDLRRRQVKNWGSISPIWLAQKYISLKALVTHDLFYCF